MQVLVKCDSQWARVSSWWFSVPEEHWTSAVNGPYKLAMIAGTDNKLPYGNLPRLLLAWVCTEAVRTQSRVLILGDSVSEFMRKLDIYSTSGEKYTRLRNQMGIIYLTHNAEASPQHCASSI